MKITKEIIESFKPCYNGYNWYLNNGSNDLKETLLNVSKVNFDWATWLIVRLMNKKQNLELAIFSAESVLYIYEAKYDDLRPRKAILAAKKVLENDNKKNRELAFNAAEDAFNAYYSNYASSKDASNAAYSAASAAYYNAANAAYDAYYYNTDAASDAANAVTNAFAVINADTAIHSAKKAEFQIEIINKAMEILERK